VRDLAAALDQLLTEPRPRREHRCHACRDSPIGRSHAVFYRACDLVVEVNYVELLAGWEGRQAQLRGWRSALSAGVIAGAADELWADVEDLRVRGKAQWEHIATMHRALAAACGRVSAILDGCRERQVAIRAVWQIPAEVIENVAAQRRLPVAAREELATNQIAAGELIAAETQRVLDLHPRTAGVSVAELWGALAQQN